MVQLAMLFWCFIVGNLGLLIFCIDESGFDLEYFYREVFLCR
jgi:hypothetical protein